MPLIETDIETERLRFFYRKQGDPGGLPMLLLHGSHASSRWWLPLLEVMPHDILAIAPDLRGCGQSDKPNSGYDIRAQAEDLAALVEALDLRQIDLVAHSSSGAIAIEFALAHPEALSTLTLIAPPSVEGVATPIEALALLEEMRGNRQLHSTALAALMPTLDTGDRANAAFFESLVDDAQAMAPAAFTDIAISLGAWDRLAQVGELTLPTLLIWGDRDEIVSRDAVSRTLIAIPGANNLEVLQGVGHSPMIESPLVLAERLMTFLSDDMDAFAAIRQEAYSEQRDAETAPGAKIDEEG